jgi:hypothetical protein
VMFPIGLDDNQEVNVAIQSLSLLIAHCCCSSIDDAGNFISLIMNLLLNLILLGSEFALSRFYTCRIAPIFQ